MNSKLHSAALIFIAYLFLCPILSHAKTILEGHIESSSWERNGNPYIITDTLFVPEGKTLHIGPGVKVYTKFGYPINVWGTIICEGTEQSPILLSSFNQDEKWDGLRIRPGGHGDLKYTIVEYGGTVRTDEMHGGGVNVVNGSIIMEHCIVRYNDSDNDGGGMYITLSDYQITHCVFHNNSCKRVGSAIVFANYNKEGTFAYNLIHDNSTGASGAICIGDPYITIDHCTFYNNEASQYNGARDIWLTPFAFGNVTNSIFWHDNDSEKTSIDHSSGQITLAYCLIEDTKHFGEALFDADPLFLDPENDDFRLSPNSPCINKGDPFFKKDSDGSTTDLGAFQAVSHPPQD